MPIITPINIMEIAIRPVSLCMRLFGNVIGAFVIMELLKMLMPVILPIPFSLYFDIFDGLIQTYVFCLSDSSVYERTDGVKIKKSEFIKQFFMKKRRNEL